MANASNTLEFRITTPAELAGAQAAADALERQIGKAKALKQDYSELQKQLDTVKTSLKENTAASATEGDALADAGKQTDKLTIKKRELSESIRLLTRQFPLLGEVAHVVFNPISAAIFGIIGAFEIWITKIKEATVVFGGVKMPDLTSGIQDAENLSFAWDKVAHAVADADRAFDSAKAVHDRNLAAINAELKAVKDLIAAIKEKAIADLDIQRAAGQLTPAEYAAHKAMIEQGANAQTEKAEADARNAAAAAKVQQQKDAEAAAAKARAAVEVIRQSFHIPESDKTFSAQQAELKMQADATRKMAEDASKRIQDIRAIGGDDFGANMKGRAMFPFRYGVSTTLQQGSDLEAQNEKTAKDAADALEKTIARRDAAKKEYDDQVKQQAEAAAEAERLKRENADNADPNKPGSNAWQNAQAAAAAKMQAGTSGAKQFAGDLDQANKDIAEIAGLSGKKTVTPEDIAKAHAAAMDVHAALVDAALVISRLAGMGEDVTQIKNELAEAKKRVSRIENNANLH